MNRDGAQTLSEKPLLGAVLCCTSIAPEDRTRLAEYAEQMGAEHKLDLTSDVTHLLVGSTDTPKYQYVAREREDVKVLRPEWVEAVREHWMEDRPIDMNVLEAEYRMPTLAGLKICITGFDDLAFRAQLQKNVVGNGGEYTGDLTKDVTHLIAAKAEGKKYEYATLWQKKVVSLQWYKDSLERGMQLDESSYHPTRSPETQGLGAWNRREKKQPVTGKRTRDEQALQEPARKLRRTASVKLNSQADDMWGDIVGQTSQAAADKQDILRSGKSANDVQSVARAAKDDRNANLTEPSGTSPSAGFLGGLHFVITKFEMRQQLLIERTLMAVGATIHKSLAELSSNTDGNEQTRYLIVPHQTRPDELAQPQSSTIQPMIVTELWLERCMVQKAAIPIQQYPLGGVVTRINSPNIVSLTINATGFQSIEALHIARTVNLTGASYAEIFSPQSSVLVCNSMNINRQKLFHANQWNVPAVSETWLCRFLTEGSIPDFSSHLVQGSTFEENDMEAALAQTRKGRDARRSPDHNASRQGHAAGKATSTSSDSFRSANTSAGNKGGTKAGQGQSQNQQRSSRSRQQDVTELSKDRALQEISPNSPPKKNPVAQSPSKKRLFQTYHGSHDAIQEPLGGTRAAFPDVDAQPSSKKSSVPDNASINSAIEDLLNMKAKAKANAAQAQQSQSKSKKKQLLSRALSNLSNASHASRHSRASSIDSLNTDGLGSEIAPPSGKSTEGVPSVVPRPSLQDRLQQSSRASVAIASATAAPPVSNTSIDISDPHLLRDDNAFHLNDDEPQLTQLGYEDNEDAVRLREKLAEKRRARTRLGQNPGDPKPQEETITTNTTTKAKQRQKEKEREREREKEKQKKVIKDDDILNVGGWGGGGRTRAKNKSLDGTGDLDLF